MSFLSLASAWMNQVAATVGPLDQVAADSKAGQGGPSVVAWVGAVLIVLALCWVGFRKSKRTHLD